MMVKGVLLAWLLCRQKRIFSVADDHRIISALGVYRREEKGETNKYTAHKCDHKA